MGFPTPPGKSRATVHKRATSVRRYGPAPILPASVMTLPPNLMPIFPRTLTAAVLLAVAGVLAGCGEGQKQAAPPPPKVTVANPVKRTIIDQDEYVGRFVAVDVVEVRARVRLSRQDSFYRWPDRQ